MSTAIERPADERVNWASSIPFFIAHLIPLLVVFTGITTKAVILGIVLYFGRMFFITAGYHRYFSHRSFKTGRVFQFILAFGGASAAQKGALWWASHHRLHHRFSDTQRDIHSPQKGFWWSHVGWILSNKYKDTDYDLIKDFSKYPELVWLDKHDWVAPWSLGIASFLIAGWPGLVLGFFGSTVLLWHGTFTVNSLNHVFGRRRYATTDTSRNSAILALVTMGEGWHNNHHYYAASVRQGFFWWEYDVTYYIIKGLSKVGVVHKLIVPNERVKAAARVREGQLDIGMFRAHWNKASRAVHSATSSLHDRLSAVSLGRDTTTADEATAKPEQPAVTSTATATAATDVVATAAAETDPEAAQQAKIEQLEQLVVASRSAMEERVAEALRSAEEFSKLSRRHERALADN